MNTEAPAPIAEPIDEKQIEAAFRHLVGSVAADKDAKIIQLKAALLKIKAAVDEAIADIDLVVTAPPAPVNAPAPRAERCEEEPQPDANKPERKEPYSDRGEDAPLLVDLSRDLDARELLEKWASTGAHHIRYKLAEHLGDLGYEIEANTLLLRGEAADLDLMAARQVVQTAINYTVSKETEARMLRGCIEKLFGKWKS